MLPQDHFVVSTLVKSLSDHISLGHVKCRILMDSSLFHKQNVQVLVRLLEKLGVTIVQDDIVTVIKEGGVLLVLGTPEIRKTLLTLVTDKDFVDAVNEVEASRQRMVSNLIIPILLGNDLTACFPDHPYFLQLVLDFNVTLFGEVFYDSLKRLISRIWGDHPNHNALESLFSELVGRLKAYASEKRVSSMEYNYGNATMFNLTSISRSAMDGIIDLSTDGDCNGLLGSQSLEKSKCFCLNFLKQSSKEEIKEIVQKNFEIALEGVISKAKEIKPNRRMLNELDIPSFIKKLALQVNDNITEKDCWFRNYNYQRLPFTKNSLLEPAFEDFCSVLMGKVQDLFNQENKRERKKFALQTAAWIEYRFNLTDHFLVDGCSRVALLLTVFVLILADCEVPVIINGTNYFKNLPSKVRNKLCNIQDQVQYSIWLKHYLSLFRRPFKVLISDLSRDFHSDEDLIEYYQTLGLDSLHILSKSSTGATGYSAYEGKKEVLTGEHLSVSRRSGATFSNFIGVVQYLHQEGVPKLQQCLLECKERGNQDDRNLCELEKCLDDVLVGIVSRILKNRKLPLDGREIRNYFRRKDSKYLSISHQKLDEKYDFFLRELSLRLLKSNDFDIIETISLIDYRISFHYHFFLDGNIRIAQALVLLICMTFKIHGPEFSEELSRKRLSPRFPINTDDCCEDEQFQYWFRYYRSLYRAFVSVPHGGFEICLDREDLQITDFNKIYLSLQGSMLYYRTAWAVNPERLYGEDALQEAFVQTLVAAVERDDLDRLSLSLMSWLVKTLIGRKHLSDAKITTVIENISNYKVCLDSEDCFLFDDFNMVFLSLKDSKLFYRTTEVDGRHTLDFNDDATQNENLAVLMALTEQKRLYDVSLSCHSWLVQTLARRRHLVDPKSTSLHSFTLCFDSDPTSLVADSTQILLSGDPYNLYYRTVFTDERQPFESGNDPILNHVLSTLRSLLQGDQLQHISRSSFTWLIRLLLEKKHLIDSKTFSNPWTVAWKNIAPEESTIFQNISRSVREVTTLMNATGDSVKNMVVFNPTRMALHRGIVYVTTRYNYELADKGKLEEILNKMLTDDTVSRSLRNFNKDFETAKEELEFYVNNQVFADYFGILKDQELMNFMNNTRDKITKRVAEGKCRIRPSQSRDLMKQLVIDKMLRDDFERKIEVVVDHYFSGEAFTTAYKEYKLTFMPNFERIAWAIVGGPASGKTSLMQYVNRQIQTADYCVVNPDNYKHLLHTESVTQLKKNYAMLVHEESSFIADRILSELKAMVEKDDAPNILLDTVKSSDEKMKIIGFGGATVYLNIASCPIEGETGALARAFKRASTEGKDFGRFVPTEEVLAGHKKESQILPSTIQDFRINLRLFDTSTGRKARLAAVIDTHDKNMKIYHLPGFVAFIKKTLINEKATSETQAYNFTLDGKELAKLFSEYILKGISLIFLKGKATLAIMDCIGGIICNNYDLLRQEFVQLGSHTFLDDLLSYFITESLHLSNNTRSFLNVFIYDNTGSCVLKRSLETGHEAKCSMKLKKLSNQLFCLVQPPAMPELPNGFIQSITGASKGFFLNDVLQSFPQQLEEIAKNPNIVAPVINNPQARELLNLVQSVRTPGLEKLAESFAAQFLGQSR